MQKLTKAEFNAGNRFRKARNNSGVNCSTCTNLLRIEEPSEEAFCDHEDRVRKVRLEPLVESSPFYFGSHSTVCDGYESLPLPMDVTLPALLEGQAISLGSQWNDILHADPNCPYVLGEVMMEGGNRRAGVKIVDISNLVIMEVISKEICEMPCCDSRLSYQTWRVDNYRRGVGIKPDGSEEKLWVRKVVDHENKVNMTPQEAEAFFDLGRFDGGDSGEVHKKIFATIDYLREKCNDLGSRPLAEAANPVRFSGIHHFLREPEEGIGEKLDVLVYDERLFDKRRILGLSLRELPEGIILCRDTNNALWNAMFYVDSVNSFGGTYSFIGIVRRLDAHSERFKELTHFLDIRAIVYHGANSIWGVFGRGFNHIASFHEE